MQAFGGGLPPVGGHSWHVEVFDRETGWLGLFRQSRVTVLWFQGRHSLHAAGNPCRPLLKKNPLFFNSLGRYSSFAP